MPAFEHGDAGAKPRRLPRHREAGKPRPDHADIDIQVERQPRAPGSSAASGPLVVLVEGLAHDVFLRTDAALVTLSWAWLVD